MSYVTAFFIYEVSNIFSLDMIDTVATSGNDASDASEDDESVPFDLIELRAPSEEVTDVSFCLALLSYRLFKARSFVMAPVCYFIFV